MTVLEYEGVWSEYWWSGNLNSDLWTLYQNDTTSTDPCQELAEGILVRSMTTDKKIKYIRKENIPNHTLSLSFFLIIILFNKLNIDSR